MTHRKQALNQRKENSKEGAVFRGDNVKVEDLAEYNSSEELHYVLLFRAHGEEDAKHQEVDKEASDCEHSKLKAVNLEAVAGPDRKCEQVDN